MKKIFTMACAAVMAIASSMMTFAEDAKPVAAVTNTYTFENAEHSEATIDTYANPFKNKGLDVASIQYTVTIDANAMYFTGYDTVMTFGTSEGKFIYICNELVGMNGGGFVDYWPSGSTGVQAYPGKGETYTVNLVFSSEGVAFYVNGEKKPGSNTAAANADGEVGTLTGADILNFLNTEDTLNIGENMTSYWREQDMVLSNIVFFDGEVTSPYTLTGSEAKPGKIDEKGEVVTEATTVAADTAATQAAQPQVIVQENSSDMTMIMILVVVIVVVVIGVAAMVILSQKRR